MVSQIRTFCDFRQPATQEGFSTGEDHTYVALEGSMTERKRTRSSSHPFDHRRKIKIRFGLDNRITNIGSKAGSTYPEGPRSMSQNIQVFSGGS